MGLLYTIFLMTVAGSIGFSLFKATRILGKDCFSSSWNYTVLKWIAVLFILPLTKLSEFIQIPVLSNRYSVLTFAAANPGAGIDNGRTFIESFGATVHEVARKDIGDYIVFVWLIGFTVFTVWQVISFIKLRKSVKKCKAITSELLLSILEHCKNKLNIHCTVKLVAADKAVSPMLVGFFSPTIVLPNEILTKADAEYIFMHELIHFKAKDLWIKNICTAIKAIHWFNPVAHLLCREMEMWREFSCDAKVAKNLSHEQRKQYGLAILNAMTASAVSALLVTPFASTKPNIERRLTNMLNFKKMKPSKKILSMAVAVAILACSAVPALAAENTVTETPNKVSYSQNEDVSTFSNQVSENASGAILDSGDINVNQPSPYASGDLSAGKAYSYDSQELTKGQTVTINADWTPTGSNIKIGLKSSSGTITAKTVSSGSGSVTYTISASGNYSIYVGNPSTANVKFEVSYIVN